MAFILSLAHFCDIHGPTSILCTQAISEPCSLCPSSSAYSSSPSTATSSAPSTPAEERSRPMFPQPHEETKDDQPLTPMFQSSPISPVAEHGRFPFSSKATFRNGSSKSARSSTDDTQRCQSCKFTIPSKNPATRPSTNDGVKSFDSNSSTPQSMSPPSSSDGPASTCPVLRTRMTLLVAGSPSPTNSFTSDSSRESTSPSELNRTSFPLHLQGISRQATNSSVTTHSTSSTAGTFTNSYSSTPPISSSFTGSQQYQHGTQQPRHKHTTTLLTSHTPTTSLTNPLTYLTLRRSCIRALSTENLPRGSSSGSILFGDATSGYTIAFIFRVPDPRARGRRRTYAFLALNTNSDNKINHTSHSTTAKSKSNPSTTSPTHPPTKGPAPTPRQIMAALPIITATFATLASRIIGLSEHKIASDRRATALREEAALHSPAATSSNPNLKGMTLTPVSSFLSAKGVDPDGVPHHRFRSTVTFAATVTGGSDGNGASSGSHDTWTLAAAAAGGAARSLADITGRETLFVEVHVAFVKLLVELASRFGL